MKLKKMVLKPWQTLVEEFGEVRNCTETAELKNVDLHKNTYDKVKSEIVIWEEETGRTFLDEISATLEESFTTLPRKAFLGEYIKPGTEIWVRNHDDFDWQKQPFWYYYNYPGAKSLLRAGSKTWKQYSIEKPKEEKPIKFKISHGKENVSLTVDTSNDVYGELKDIMERLME